MPFPSYPGTFGIHIFGLTAETNIYVAAYATNGSGTSYGVTIEGFSNLCLMEGTKISLADGGTKNIEDVTYDDELLVWDFDNGQFASAKPVWMVQPFKASSHVLIRFSDGSELGTIPDGKGHRVFNKDQGAFTHMISDTPIGTKVGDDVTVVGREDVAKETTFYNVITHTHINVFANGILTSTGLNNLYPIEGMKFVKEERSPRSKEEFVVSEELFSGLRLAEQPVSYPELQEKISRMVRRQCLVSK